eukprot:3935175-Rhodomonas_salina.1
MSASSAGIFLNLLYSRDILFNFFNPVISAGSFLNCTQLGQNVRIKTEEASCKKAACRIQSCDAAGQEKVTHPVAPKLEHFELCQATDSAGEFFELVETEVQHLQIGERLQHEMEAVKLCDIHQVANVFR